MKEFRERYLGVQFDLHNEMADSIKEKMSNAALLVEAGMGSAVCLDGALSVHYSCDTCFKPVFPEHTTRSVLLWKKNRLLRPAASLFIQMIHVHGGR